MQILIKIGSLEVKITIFLRGSYFAENGNLPIFIGNNGKIMHISADSDTKRETETDI